MVTPVKLGFFVDPVLRRWFFELVTRDEGRKQTPKSARDDVVNEKVGAAVGVDEQFAGRL